MYMLVLNSDAHVSPIVLSSPAEYCRWNTWFISKKPLQYVPGLPLLTSPVCSPSIEIRFLGGVLLTTPAGRASFIIYMERPPTSAEQVAKTEVTRRA